MHACMLSCFCRVILFVTLWTVAHQAPLSMRFSRQEYWSGCHEQPGDLLSPGIEPLFHRSPALAGRFFTTSTTWEAQKVTECLVWDIIPNFKNLKFTKINTVCVCDDKRLKILKCGMERYIATLSVYVWKRECKVRSKKFIKEALNVSVTFL